MWSLKTAWKLIVLVVGLTVVLLGVVLIFTPGPAFVVIPLGLAILATEFVWARNLLKKVKQHIRERAQQFMGHDKSPPPPDATDTHHAGKEP